MDKAERLYNYINDCFTVDVMCSIFCENYEFTNQSIFYNQLLDKYEIFEKLLNKNVTDDQFVRKLSLFREEMDKNVREYFIYCFITYCSKSIDQKYLQGKRINMDHAQLEQQNHNYCSLKERLVNELENSLVDIQKECGLNVVEFITKATVLLRKKEEEVFEKFN